MDSPQTSEIQAEIPSIGLIYEGATDYQVIENILIGYLGDEENFDLVALQPLLDETDTQENQGGWEKVLLYCSSPQFQESLDAKDFIIIQIDTDRIFTHPNFSGINTKLPYQELYDEIIQGFIKQIGTSTYTKYQKKIIFAISMDMIECWLLVLHCKEKLDAIQGCIKRLSHCLKKANSKINPYAKKSKDYDKLSKEFRKNRVLMKSYPSNPNLTSFIDELKAIQ